MKFIEVITHISSVYLTKKLVSINLKPILKANATQIIKFARTDKLANLLENDNALKTLREIKKIPPISNIPEIAVFKMETAIITTAVNNFLNFNLGYLLRRIILTENIIVKSVAAISNCPLEHSIMIIGTTDTTQMGRA